MVYAMLICIIICIVLLYLTYERVYHQNCDGELPHAAVTAHQSDVAGYRHHRTASYERRGKYVILLDIPGL